MSGRLVIAGGAIAQSKDEIYSAFLENVTGHIGIVTAASEEPKESYQAIVDSFLLLGIKKEQLFELPRQLTNAHLEQLRNADAVWITGGDQLALYKAFIANSESLFLKELKDLFHRGKTVGGTSAGAAVMSDPMIVRGTNAGSACYPVALSLDDYHEDNDQTTYEQLLLLPGFGLFSNGIIDQHFNRRERELRLHTALMATEKKIGYGISEDTALCVEGETFKVLGSGYVLVMKVLSDGTTSVVKHYKN